MRHMGRTASVRDLHTKTSDIVKCSYKGAETSNGSLQNIVIPSGYTVTAFVDPKRYHLRQAAARVVILGVLAKQ